MPVSPPLLFCLMAYPSVDESLVDASGSAIANEAVPQRVPAWNRFPFALAQDHVQMMACLIRRHTALIAPGFAITNNAVVCRERVRAWLAFTEPLSHRLRKLESQWNNTGCTFAPGPFSLANHNRSALKIEVSDL